MWQFSLTHSSQGGPSRTHSWQQGAQTLHVLLGWHSFAGGGEGGGEGGGDGGGQGDGGNGGGDGGSDGGDGGGDGGVHEYWTHSSHWVLFGM
eukprot:CAMPEP_0181212488 /NCGR_PEP_ID=MMETSP1096-20121128/24374_1 /TAXON_ID=156174 ORGANISM="Chrysochromulina ericina, Strain CCMP281" /NCGR_SAMPLE_ID=MMETSP1096 /ASSEMBLY_ACC=CAM_ASM_000453 /LENGTH=91 /DNA_ID=CAMNT_0023304015 /DNA_START=446 /DNA_END=721 /DNA_ORIENTATION=-